MKLRKLLGKIRSSVWLFCCTACQVSMRWGHSALAWTALTPYIFNDPYIFSGRVGQWAKSIDFTSHNDSGWEKSKEKVNGGKPLTFSLRFAANGNAGGAKRLAAFNESFGVSRIHVYCLGWVVSCVHSAIECLVLQVCPARIAWF